MESKEGSPEKCPTVFGLASAIVRLYYLRQVGFPSIDRSEGKRSIAMVFRAQGPLCRCCGKPMDRAAWLRSVIGPYGREILNLLAAEESHRSAPG